MEAYGVAYWRRGDDERIVILAVFAQMIALDAKTGKPLPKFGVDWDQAIWLASSGMAVLILSTACPIAVPSA